MKIISLVNSKGGVGKTTLATNLCRYVQLYVSTDEHKDKNTNVLLVDADPQKSAREWFEQGGSQLGIDLIALDTRAALMNIADMKMNYDYVIIDSPGKAGDLIAASIIISDLVLIPVQPSPYDVWATDHIANLITERQNISGGKPECRYLLNRCIPNTNAFKDVKEHLNTCTHKHLNSCIYQRQVYADSAKDGQSIFESGNRLAIGDLQRLGDEIIEVLNGL